MCNPKLLAVAAIGAAAFTGGASLGLFGTAATAAEVGTGAGMLTATAGTGIYATGSVAAGMTAAQVASIGLSATGTLASAAGQAQAADTQKKVAEYNVDVAKNNAASALAAGEQDAINIQRRGAAIKGAQRAGMAANGVDLNVGTAAALQDQTDFFTAQDVATARTNARRQAYNAETQGMGYQAQAEGYSPLMAGAGTLLSGGGQVSDKWYLYNKGY